MPALLTRSIAALSTLALGAIAPSAASAYTASFPTVGGAKPAAACTNPPVSQAFLKFKDLADYALAPGGDFEPGAAGWVLKNAAIVPGNDTSGVLGGKFSVQLGISRSGGAAEVTSPEFCVTRDHPSFRFLVRSVGSSVYKSGFGSNIVYRTTSDLGKSYLDTVDISYGTTSWAPSAKTPLATAIPDAKFAAGVLVKIKFYLPSYNVKDGGAIQIDNVLVDPFRRT